MKKELLVGMLSIFSLTAGYSQTKEFWTAVAPQKANALGQVKKAFELNDGTLKFVSLDATRLRAALASAPTKESGATGVIITIPTLNGTTEHFRVVEASNFAPGLQAAHQDIRSYAGNGVEDPTAYLRFSVSPKGIQTMVLRANGKTEFIEPYTTNGEVYALFTSGAKRAAKGQLPFTCWTPEDQAVHNAAQHASTLRGLSDASTLKTFRLALSCTAEYTIYHGGAKADALAAMNATMTRVNGVYENDLAVHLNLIEDELDIIYTSTSTDPYSPASGINNWNGQLQTTLTNVIGEANYDIGHLFGASGGGGNAGCIGCVCVNGQKGSGITSPIDGIPEGDNYDIDYVSHEMGHQLGATHTYSVNDEGSGTNVEPGSGSTIMGYAGITGPADIQRHSDDYFAYISIAQIQFNLEDKACAVNTTLTNPAITVNAGPNYAIPKGTAFVLRGVGSEANGDNVTYNWEQNDDANGAFAQTGGFPSATSTVGASFRSVPPSASDVRYMPAFNRVLNNQLSSTWETVSNVARSLHFTLTGRDNVAGGGQTATDEVTVNVRNFGPFAVTSQNTDNLAWQLNSQQTVTWDVAGTTANNINTANVNILLSTDGGATFATVLAANTPNDGSEVIAVPAGISGTNCRIMIEAVGNIFYALNQKSFGIGFTTNTTCEVYTNDANMSIPDGAVNYTSQTLTVPSTGTVTSVNVTAQVTHSYVSDLVIAVTNPAGVQANLWNQQCGGNNNLNVTFSDGANALACGNPTSGTYAPQDPLSVFAGADAQGTWTLDLIDLFQGDAGTLTSWSLEVCTQTAIPLGTEDFGLSNFSVYPNPNKGSFTVAFNSNSDSKIGIMVHDISGRQVFNNTYDNTGLFSGNVNLSSVQSGIYMVTVQDGTRKEVRKIIVN